MKIEIQKTFCFIEFAKHGFNVNGLKCHSKNQDFIVSYSLQFYTLNCKLEIFLISCILLHLKCAFPAITFGNSL